MSWRWQMLTDGRSALAGCAEQETAQGTPEGLRSKTSLRRPVQWGMAVLLAAVTLWLSLREVRWTGIQAAFSQTDLLLVLCSLGIVLLTTVGKAVRWRILLQPCRPQVSGLRLVRILLIGQMGNSFLPMRLGDVSRAVLLGPQATGGSAAVLGTIVVEKSLDGVRRVIQGWAAMDSPPEAGRPSVSVVVPVYNGSETLDACLKALADQTIHPAMYEVIAVDDGSEDGSAEVAARHGVRVLRQAHFGAAAARNHGAQEARGEILLFTDADCEPLPDWIEKMLLPFADPSVVGVKGAYLTKQRSAVARFVQAEYEEKYEHLAREKSIDFVDTHSAAYRCRAFIEAGGFDRSFAFDEDQELSYRLAETGSQLVFARGARVWHQHPVTVWQYMRRKVIIGRWKVKVHLLHPSKIVHDSYTPWSQKAQLVLMALMVSTGIGASVGGLPWVFAAASLALALLATIPLVRKAMNHGWVVAVLAPGMALVRALALVSGVAWGVAGELLALIGR